MWKITFNNDTGACDECYEEWWEVSNGEKTFRSDSKEDTEWLRDVLNFRWSQD